MSGIWGICNGIRLVVPSMSIIARVRVCASIQSNVTLLIVMYSISIFYLPNKGLLQSTCSHKCINFTNPMPETLFFPSEEIVTPLYLDGTNATLAFGASPARTVVLETRCEEGSKRAVLPLVKSRLFGSFVLCPSSTSCKSRAGGTTESSFWRHLALIISGTSW